MDNKIDWSLAPNWANAVVRSSDGSLWFVTQWGVRSETRQKVDYAHTDGCAADMTIKDHEWKFVCERPRKQWSGPQDGLPPISSVVMAKRPDNDKWIKSEVLKHGNPSQARRVCAFMELKTNKMFWSNEYDSVKTPEQISNELRESKIVEFMNTVGIDCRVTATKAVDSGYVRVGE